MNQNEPHATLSKLMLFGETSSSASTIYTTESTDTIITTTQSSISVPSEHSNAEKLTITSIGVGTIVGICTAIAAVLLILGAIAFRQRRRSKTNQEAQLAARIRRATARHSGANRISSGTFETPFADDSSSDNNSGYLQSMPVADLHGRNIPAVVGDWPFSVNRNSAEGSEMSLPISKSLHHSYRVGSESSYELVGVGENAFARHEQIPSSTRQKFGHQVLVVNNALRVKSVKAITSPSGSELNE